MKTKIIKKSKASNKYIFIYSIFTLSSFSFSIQFFFIRHIVTFSLVLFYFSFLSLCSPYLHIYLKNVVLFFSIFLFLSLCFQSWASRPLSRQSKAARPPSATGMDVAARFNVAVGMTAITAERHGIWTGFLRRYTEAVEILKTLARCCSAHLRGCDPGDATTSASAATSSTPRSTLQVCNTIRTFLSQSE